MDRRTDGWTVNGVIPKYIPTTHTHKKKFLKKKMFGGDLFLPCTASDMSTLLLPAVFVAIHVNVPASSGL